MDDHLLIVKVLDMSFQDFGMIDDFAALGTRIVATAVVVDQMLLVVLGLDQLATKLTHLQMNCMDMF